MRSVEPGSEGCGLVGRCGWWPGAARRRWVGQAEDRPLDPHPSGVIVVEFGWAGPWVGHRRHDRLAAGAVHLCSGLVHSNKPGVGWASRHPRPCLSGWWRLQPGPRLARTVRPPRAWSRVWSRSQRRAGRRQPGWLQVRSRTWTWRASAGPGKRSSGRPSRAASRACRAANWARCRRSRWPTRRRHPGQEQVTVGTGDGEAPLRPPLLACHEISGDPGQHGSEPGDLARPLVEPEERRQADPDLDAGRW